MTNLIAHRDISWEEGVAFFEELSLIRAGRRQTNQRRLRIFDTFDWLLWSRDFALEVERLEGTHHWRWTRLEGQLLRRFQSRQPPRFAEELPTGPFRSELEAITEIRRLLPRMVLETVTDELSLEDRWKKTTLRLELSQAQAAPILLNGRKDAAAQFPIGPVLRVQGLKGYERDYFEVLDRLERKGYLQRAPSLVERALRGASPPAGTYRSKPFVPMKPKDPAVEVLIRILKAQLGVLEANVEGTRRDLDPEFLHDLRVAIRRSRSVLGQMKGVLKSDELAPYLDQLRNLGRITGPLRDLDVFKIDIDSLVGELSPRNRPQLNPLHQFLSLRHGEEQKRLSGELQAKRFSDFISRWKTFLDQPPVGPRGEEPIRPLVQERTWRRWRRMKKRALRIDDHSPDDDLHEVRLDAKKLRYQMEFFGLLFDKDSMRRLVKALKELQEVLGSFNDRCVQVECLSRYSEEMVTRGDGEASTLLVMGRLQAVLDDQRRDFKHQFRMAFDRFLTFEPLMSKLFRRKDH